MTTKLVLPRNLVHLAAIPEDSGRHATGGIMLRQTADGYDATATDCKSLLRVTGRFPAEPSEIPGLAALDAAPNGATNALIPASAWKEAFGLVPKPKKHDKPALQNLVVVMGEQMTTAGATDLERERTLSTRNVEGRFPNADEVLKSTQEKPIVATPATEDGKEPITATIAVDAKRLAELLKIMSEFAPEDNNRVVLELRGSEQPLVLRTKNGSQHAVGIVCPLLK